MLHQTYRFLSSVKLTVFLLAASMLLVFFGTLDQVYWGIHKAQQEYFESLIVIWPYRQGAWIYPGVPLLGGYTLGVLLLVNLSFGFFRYTKLTWAKAGIAMIHGGIVLLLVSGFLISFYQQETQMRLDEGGSSNYTYSFRDVELVIVDKSAPDVDTVFSVPQSTFEIGMPYRAFDGLEVKLREFFPNSNIGMVAQNPGRTPVAVTRGAGATMELFVDPLPVTYAIDRINIASAIVEVSAYGQPIGSWLASNLFSDFPPQTFTSQNKTYEIALRMHRTYYPFTLELIDFTHDRYPGTNIPKNFSSEVNVIDPATNENRKALIYMNHPLRYAGLTFFQQGFDNDDTTSFLQVVRNPAWQLPYWSVLLVGVGMGAQFVISLMRFFNKSSAKIS